MATLNKKRAQVVLNAEMMQRLMAHKPLTVRIPEGVRELTIHSIAVPRTSNPVAEILDVFFNGRPAKR